MARVSGRCEVAVVAEIDSGAAFQNTDFSESAAWYIFRSHFHERADYAALPTIAGNT